MKRASVLVAVGVAVALGIALYASRNRDASVGSIAAPPSAATEVFVETTATPHERMISLEAAVATPRVHAAWGGRRGELGRSRPQEGNPEGPMSFAATSRGLFVLDQVNGRMLRYDARGNVVSSQTIPITTQDIAVGKDGTVALLDRLGEKSVTLTDANGRVTRTLPLGNDPGLITGVFLDGSNVYVEQEHGGLVGVGTTDGQPLTTPTLGGRPSKDGSLLVTATLVGPEGKLTVNAIDRASGTLRYARIIQVAKPAIVVVLLDSDSSGIVYAGVAAGSPETANIVCLDPKDGHVIGRVNLPMSTEPDESFRDYSVDDDGTIVYALRTAAGVDYATARCPP